jgi:hypothetical protein
VIGRGLRTLGFGGGGTTRGRPGALLVGGAIVATALAGAFLFGLVHIVGGTMRGNANAVAFGIGLSAVTGPLLAGLALLARRRLHEPTREPPRRDQ